MTLISVDFGAVTTKVAAWSLSAQRPVIHALIPSVFYVGPHPDAIFVGEAALRGLKSDRKGIIEAFKATKLGMRTFHQNGLDRNPCDVLAVLFSEIRRRLTEIEETKSGHSLCALTVPPDSDSEQRECIHTAARRAGFQQTIEVEEPLAVIRYLTQKQPVHASTVALCDIGTSFRLSILEQRENKWRLRREMCHPAAKLPDEWRLTDEPIASELSSSKSQGISNVLHNFLIRELSAASNLLHSNGLSEIPFGFVGGQKDLLVVAQIARQSGWAGQLLEIPEPEFAVVFGAIEPPKAAQRARLTRYDPTAPA